MDPSTIDPKALEAQAAQLYQEKKSFIPAIIAAIVGYKFLGAMGATLGGLIFMPKGTNTAALPQALLTPSTPSKGTTP